MHQYRQRFRDGILLTAAPALLVTLYAFAKNNDIQNLVLFVPSFFMIGVIGFTLSYFAYMRIDRKLNLLDISSSAIIFFYTIDIILSIQIIYWAFVFFKIPYAFLLLPVTVSVTGAYIFLLLIRIVSFMKLSNKTKLIWLISMSALLAAALLVVKVSEVT